MSTSELAAEKVKQLSEEEAEAVLNYIGRALPSGSIVDSNEGLEAACRAANQDSALSQDIAEWQSFHDSLPE